MRLVIRGSDALAVYLLNPATLYWTVFQGYHSIAQTAYFMAALYFLLRGRHTIGYVVGLYGLAGAKLIAVLDWPALLAVSRPRVSRQSIHSKSRSEDWRFTGAHRSCPSGV